MSHGGKREGAGRKARSTQRVALTFRVEPEIAAKFERLREAANRSQVEQFTEMVRRARER